MSLARLLSRTVSRYLRHREPRCLLDDTRQRSIHRISCAWDLSQFGEKRHRFHFLKVCVLHAQATSLRHTVLYFLLTLMNSIQLVSPRKLELRQMPMPPNPKPGEVP